MGSASEFQLANYYWSNEEPAAAAGLPVDYASIMDIFGTCYYYTPEAYVPPQSIGVGGQQLAVVEPYSSAASLHSSSSSPTDHEVVIYMDGKQNRHQVTTEISAGNKQQVVDSLKNEEMDDDDDSRVRCVFKQVGQAYRADINLIEYKMHSLLANPNNDSYTVPRFVAIGPYHHGLAHLKKAEKDKHMAAICCVRESRHSLQEIYDAVVPVADDARRLYDKDVTLHIGFDDFRHMMFFDACFLVQFILMDIARMGLIDPIDPSLLRSLRPNSIDIRHDVMLLENQIPWQVVETIMRFRRVPLLPIFVVNFIGFLQDHPHPDSWDVARFEDYNNPPHLLGFVRHIVVGTSGGSIATEAKEISVSASAMELAEIGITLKAKETTGLIHMELEEGTLLAKLSLAPLTLDRNRASYLVNMAALEMRSVESFNNSPDEASAVCSYLLLLAMLVYKEEDVDELRARGILEGGGGLSNKEALRFFSSIQGLRLGPCYNRVMRQIANYKDKKWMWTRLHSFYYKRKKTIYQAFSFIIGVITIFGTLVGILVKLKSLKAAR